MGILEPEAYVITNQEQLKFDYKRNIFMKKLKGQRIFAYVYHKYNTNLLRLNILICLMKYYNKK